MSGRVRLKHVAKLPPPPDVAAAPSIEPGTHQMRSEQRVKKARPGTAAACESMTSGALEPSGRLTFRPRRGLENGRFSRTRQVGLTGEELFCEKFINQEHDLKTDEPDNSNFQKIAAAILGKRKNHGGIASDELYFDFDVPESVLELEHAA